MLLICALAGVPACSKEAPKQSVPLKEAPAAQSGDPIDVPAAGYSLSVVPTLLPNGSVSLAIQTNIPGSIEVMASLALSGQGDYETYIGDGEKVSITNGHTTVNFDTDDLPSGDYDAEVSFYPRWGFKDATSRATGIAEKLTASVHLSIAGSGQSAADVQTKNAGLRWVMENVTIGDPWRPAEWQKRFGKYEKIPIDSRALNPKIIKAYYFPKIDVTLIINSLKGSIVIYRKGRADS